MKWALAAAGLVLAGGVLATAPASAATIYQNDFESGSTAGFSGGSIQTAPNGQKFLGHLSQNSYDFTVTGLDGYDSVTINFDLYTINSLDGTAQFNCCGPDYFTVKHGTDTLLHDTFTNNSGWYQTYGGGATPGPNGSDPLLTLQLGYNNTYGPDHTYHMSFTVPHDGSSSAVFSFIAATDEGEGNESFGLDNFVVTANVSSVPIPAALPLFASGLAALGWVGARRRKAKGSAA